MYHFIHLIKGKCMNILKVLGITAVTALVFSFSGCAPANIASQIRDNSDNTNMMTRCVEVDMRSQSEMDEAFAKFDGWRVIYISEYTTGNKIGTSGSICFEKSK
jgi:hypothetical protein